MPCDQGRFLVTQSIDQADSIFGKIDHAEFGQFNVISGAVTTGHAISPLIGRNDVKSETCDWDKKAAPTIGEFGKPMEQKDQWVIAIARFQEMNGESVAVFQHTGCNAFW